VRQVRAVKHHISTFRPTPNNPVAGETELLTDEQAAAFFSIKTRTLRLWRTKGLPFVRISKKVIRYRRIDVNTWVARKRVVIAS
jgi:hypothetical protein